MTAPGKLQIAVIGAGIAGLAATIGLKDHPAIDVQIYERATELREIGASIALGPNGMRTLDRLGVDNALDDAVAFRNKSKLPMIYKHYKTNETVSVDEHKGSVEYRHQTARYYRAHLQQALAQHVDPSRIHFSKAFSSVSFDESIQKLLIRFSDGTTAIADLLFGADGVHSRVRTHFVPSSSTTWTGWTAFRSVFPASHLSHIKDLPDEAVHVWGPDRTLFLSHLGEGLYTVVGSTQSDPDAPDAPYKGATWNEDGHVSVLKEYYADWSPLVRAIIDAVPYTRIYPNARAHALDTWVLGDQGRVTLAGDAAHAHGGAFAAGGSLALDDAWAFASSVYHVFPVASSSPGALSNSQDMGESINRTLKLYERTRKAHTDQVMEVVKEGNEKTVQRFRKFSQGWRESDGELRRRMQTRGDTSWIHEHDVVSAFERAIREEDDKINRGVGGLPDGGEEVARL